MDQMRESALEAKLIIVALLVFIAIRETFFLITTHRLINKIMSTNYRDFQLSSNPGRMDTEVKPKFDDPQDDEDLGSLTGIL